MITQEEARATAQAWVGADGPEIGMHEFDLGWVVWAEVDDRIDPARPPQRLGDSRGVVDRDAGEVFVYPPMPADDVAERHRWRKQAYQRFPRDVAHALLQAGWHPGRTTPDAALDDFADLVPMLGEAGPDRPGFALHVAARDALREFGSLRVRGPGTEDVADGSAAHPTTVTVSFPPAARPSDFHLLDGLDEDLGLVVAPLAAVHPDRYEDVGIDADGRVFSVSSYTGDALLVAESVDDALVALLRGDRTVDGSFFLVVPGGLLAEVEPGGSGMDFTGRYRDRSGALVRKDADDG